MFYFCLLQCNTRNSIPIYFIDTEGQLFEMYNETTYYQKPDGPISAQAMLAHLVKIKETLF